MKKKINKNYKNGVLGLEPKSFFTKLRPIYQTPIKLKKYVLSKTLVLVSSYSTCKTTNTVLRLKL